MGQPRQHRRLSTAWVIFLVISAASPLTSFLGTTPAGILRGNGAGLPAAYLFVALVLACFAIGYAAISRRVISTGAYYTYIGQGLGRPMAVGAALLAAVAYIVNIAGIAGGTGYFIAVIAAEEGAEISWIWGAVVPLVIVGLVGYRSVHVSAKLIGTFTVLGIACLAVFDILVLVTHGLPPLSSFSFGSVTSGSVGLSVIIALSCFIGVDTAALYGEETNEPERTVPRATYIAVGTLGGLYVLSIWLLIGAIGANDVRSAAGDDMVFAAMASVGGEGLQTVAALLFIGASLAGLLAFHNAASRYVFVLGRDRVLHPRLGRLHPQHGSPYLGSVVVSVGVGLLVLSAIAFRLDPYVVLAQGALGLGTLGIILLQALAAIAIVVFFRRRGQGRYLKTFAVPLVGALGLLTAAAYLLFRFTTLLDIHNAFVAAVPWLMVAVLVVGVLVGLAIRRRSPATYARLAQSRLRPQARTMPRPNRWTRRYCLIGAGPAGLVMARRLAEEGVPFDWFERHDSIGGIWHAERAGGPVYDSLVSATSKHVSAFPGFPMPADYPDYPSWWQVRDYLRAYAKHFALTDLVTLNTAVTWAKPEGIGWSVTLTNGAFRYYSGVIAAPGTAWHPVLPTWPGQEHFRGQIWHSARYASPAELAGRRVLVVGAGDSGADIACDAARAGAVTYLSMRHGHRFQPRYTRGVPTDALLAGHVALPDGESLPTDPAGLQTALVGDLRALGLPPASYAPLHGHPTVVTDLLSYVQQGWISPRGEVVELLPDGVRFADGSTVQVDVIIGATGFQFELPFLPPETYLAANGRPDLYLNMFGRHADGLAVLGLSRFGGPAFPRFDEMARAVMVDLTLRELDGLDWRVWRAGKQQPVGPDLTGGLAFADPLAVDDHAYSTRLLDLCDRFGYAPSGTWSRPPARALV